MNVTIEEPYQTGHHLHEGAPIVRGLVHVLVLEDGARQRGELLPRAAEQQLPVLPPHLGRVLDVEAGEPGLHGRGGLVSSEDAAPGSGQALGDLMELCLLLLGEVGVTGDWGHLGGCYQRPVATPSAAVVIDRVCGFQQYILWLRNKLFQI